MRDETLQTVGNIAICWNRADDYIAKLATLYLDLDPIVFDILVKPLRATDREDLLKKAVAAKEWEAGIRTEVLEATARAKICRENRNIILHQLGGLTGELSAGSESMLDRVLSDLIATCDYLRDVHDAVRSVIQDRNAREVPTSEGESGDDELLPLVVFAPPARPSKPRKIGIDDIEVIEDEA